MDSQVENKMKNEKEDFLRQICDKQTFEALNILKSVNKNKHEEIQNRIFGYFEQNKALIQFETYLKIIKEFDQNKELNILYMRKNNDYGLDDIDSF